MIEKYQIKERDAKVKKTARKKPRDVYLTFDRVKTLNEALLKLTVPQFNKEIFMKFKERINVGTRSATGIHCWVMKFEEEEIQVRIEDFGTYPVKISDIDFIKFTQRDTPYRFPIVEKQ
jgi:hypothetical protein